MTESHTAPAHQFDNVEQQHEADTLGMWVFLATEVMFFGGLFLGYTIYRYLFPGVFARASHHLDLVLGSINTGVLLCSSLTMAFAVRSIQLGERKRTARFLAATCLLGCAFLGIKAIEYHHKFVEHLVPGRGFEFAGADPHHAQIFFWLYFAMTGLHAIHVFVGVALLGLLFVLVSRNVITREKFMTVEISGLYWHFVDIVWVFLFPLLYLAGAR
jgi:cytochrome c oxidase subunit III